MNETLTRTAPFIEPVIRCSAILSTLFGQLVFPRAWKLADVSTFCQRQLLYHFMSFSCAAISIISACLSTSAINPVPWDIISTFCILLGLLAIRLTGQRRTFIAPSLFCVLWLFHPSADLLQSYAVDQLSCHRSFCRHCYVKMGRSYSWQAIIRTTMLGDYDCQCPCQFDHCHYPDCPLPC